MKVVFSEKRTNDMSKDILTAREVTECLLENNPIVTEIECFPGREDQWGSTNEEHQKNFKAMVDALANNTCVRVVSFKSTTLSPEDNELFANMLLTNKTILEVNIFQCGERGAAAFSKMLTVNNTLKSLNLNMHSYSNEPVMSFESYNKLLSGLEAETGNKTLTYLYAFMGEFPGSWHDEPNASILAINKRRQAVMNRNRATK